MIEQLKLKKSENDIFPIGGFSLEETIYSGNQNQNQSPVAYVLGSEDGLLDKQTFAVCSGKAIKLKSLFKVK